MVLEDSELILHKAVAEASNKALAKVLSSLEKKSLGLLKKFEAVSKTYENTDDISKLSRVSSDFRTKERLVVALFALKNRVQILCDRNTARIKYIDTKLKELGIYNEKIDKKDLANIQKIHIGDVSAESINLSPNAEGAGLYKLINGNVYFVQDGKITFKNDFNQAVLVSLEASELAKIIAMFPYSVETIPAHILANVPFKQRLLKEIASYVIEEYKIRSIQEINKSLGGLLSFKSEFTENVADYVAGVQNLFDVQVKQFIMSGHPDKLQEIANKLRCNEFSELIPESKINQEYLIKPEEIAKPVADSDVVQGAAAYEIEPVELSFEEEKPEISDEDAEIKETMQLLSELLGEQEDVELEISDTPNAAPESAGEVVEEIQNTPQTGASAVEVSKDESLSEFEKDLESLDLSELLAVLTGEEVDDKK